MTPVYGFVSPCFYNIRPLSKGTGSLFPKAEAAAAHDGGGFVMKPTFRRRLGRRSGLSAARRIIAGRGYGSRSCAFAGPGLYNREPMRTILLTSFLLVVPVAAVAQTGNAIAETTLTGKPLRVPDWPDSTRQKLELDLEIAKAVFDVAPDLEDSYVWLGRRYGYLGRYAEAIEVFTAGLKKFPDSYKLHRFRGRHRARSRDFDGAIEDYRAGLEKMQGHADSFEPDGLPNSRGLTISTYRGNLHYYLGQTSFATGNYRRMIRELDLSGQSPIALDIEDHRVAAVFWKYLAHMKLGDTEAAEGLLKSVPAELDLIENVSYHQAVKVLQGVTSQIDVERKGDSLSRFALGMRLQFAGDKPEAVRVLTAVVEDNALGYWPAEVDLVALQRE